jgi:hypothetical protein
MSSCCLKGESQLTRSHARTARKRVTFLLSLSFAHLERRERRTILFLSSFTPPLRLTPAAPARMPSPRLALFALEDLPLHRRFTLLPPSLSSPPAHSRTLLRHTGKKTKGGRVAFPVEKEEGGTSNPPRAGRYCVVLRRRRKREREVRFVVAPAGVRAAIVSGRSRKRPSFFSSAARRPHRPHSPSGTATVPSSTFKTRTAPRSSRIRALHLHHHSADLHLRSPDRLLERESSSAES